MMSVQKIIARRRLWLFLALVFAGAVAVLAYVGRPWGGESQRGGSGPGGGKGRPVPVVVETVRTGDLPVYLGGLGTVTPRNSVTVRSRVDGELLRVAFEEGQQVQAGKLLAEIDPRPFQVQQLQAEGSLARDRALLANARVDLERYRTLYEQDSGSKQQWDTQKALVEQYEGAIKTDLAQIESAKLQLVYARIVAPIGGRVGLRQVDPGNIVHASDAGGIVTINEVQPIAVLFTLPEKDLPAVLRRVRSGERLPVDAYDRNLKSKLAAGSLLTLDNQIDPATGTIRLKAEFPNEDGALFPNQFVNVRLLVDRLRDATLVPAAAIQRGVQGTFVYVVGEDRTVGVRPVKLGPAEGDAIAVEEGLKPGERVVVDGADKLRDGAKVEVGGQRDVGASPDAGRGGSGTAPERPQRRRPDA
jgi:membrane fusion protein, multidrug efflux system